MRVQSEEPAVTSWEVGPTAQLAELVLARARRRRVTRRGAASGAIPAAPLVVAVDGRGGAGKSTLTRALCASVPGAVALGTDDLAWNEPLFAWERLLVEALSRLRDEGELELVPPAWPLHGRSGAVRVAAGAPLVVVEGTGASQRAAAGLLDAVVWVQSDDDVAEARGIARDVEEGVNGDVTETVRFWHEWMAAERDFFAEDRPWERADVVVAGTPTVPLDALDSAWAPGPLGPQD